jgi:hypothetical protein
LLKEGLVDVDRNVDFKYKNKFLNLINHEWRTTSDLRLS